MFLEKHGLVIKVQSHNVEKNHIVIIWTDITMTK